MSKRVFMVAGLLLNAVVSAQAVIEPPVVRVIGTGTVDMLADQVLISPLVRVEAELAKDAVVKHAALKRRAIEALEALDIKGLSVTGLGPDCEVGFPGGADPARALLRGREPATPVVICAEILQIRVERLEERTAQDRVDIVSKLLDACREGGLVFASTLNTMRGSTFNLRTDRARDRESRSVVFEFSKASDVEAAAERAAFDDARQRAERLASLAGARVGRVRVLDMTEPPEMVWNETPAKGRYSKTVRVTFVLEYDQ
ncbi:MAG: SIMPL domain-containing protein [Planctomycetes bacterium]|nr:SIMPL domain-containing protein [Planctomycetota bacterium]